MRQNDFETFGSAFGPFGGRRGGGFGPGFRAGRGMIEPAILRALSKKPMHGYEVISTLEEQSHGMWRPSAGSIYPTLQLLEEKELVKSHEENGKKIYGLTAAGEAEAAASVKPEEMWQGRRAHMHEMKQLHDDMSIARNLMVTILRKGSPEQKEALTGSIKAFNVSLQHIADGEE